MATGTTAIEMAGMHRMATEVIVILAGSMIFSAALALAASVRRAAMDRTAMDGQTPVRTTKNPFISGLRLTISAADIIKKR